MELTNEDKINISKSAAGALLKKGVFQDVDFDALVNVGFINIRSDEPRTAYWQAYAYQRRLAYTMGVHNGRVESSTLREDRRIINKPDETPLSYLIDIRDAIDSLTVEERELIMERFFEDLTYQQIADRRGVKCKGSIHWSMNSVMNKLKAIMLR